MSRAAPTSPQLPLSFDRYAVDERVSARAQRIRIEVRSPHEVRLIVPRFMPRSAAHAFLRSREAWIEQKIGELQRRQPGAAAQPTRLLWNGEDRFLLRGVERRLVWMPATVAQPSVRFDEAITLFARSALLATPAALDQALGKALRRLAHQDAQRLLTVESERLDVDWLGPRIADQRSRWGSCTAKGLISLNWRLVMAPTEVFRYVVVHELCHRVHLDHSERFWSLVSGRLPDFDTARRWLHEHGARLQRWLPAGGRS